MHPKLSAPSKVVSVLLALTLSLALSTSALAVAKRYFWQTQHTTTTAPSGTPGSDSTALPANNLLGLNLQDVKAYVVTICAPSDGLLAAAGYMRMYRYHDGATKWMRDPTLDLTVSNTGVQCEAWPDIEVPAGITGHRALAITDTVTVLYSDGGTYADAGVAVYMDAKLKTE